MNNEDHQKKGFIFGYKSNPMYDSMRQKLHHKMREYFLEKKKAIDEKTLKTKIYVN